MAITESGEIVDDNVGNIDIISFNAPGSVVVDGGSQIFYDNPTIAGDPQFGDVNLRSIGYGFISDGTLTVTGVGSRFDLNAGLNSFAGWEIGREGSGLLEVRDGGTVSVAAPINETTGLALLDLLAISNAASSRRATVIADDGIISLLGYSAVIAGGLGGSSQITARNGGVIDVTGVDFAAVLNQRGTVIVESGGRMNVQTVAPATGITTNGPEVLFRLGSDDNPLSGGTANIDGELHLTNAHGSVALIAGRTSSGIMVMDGGHITMSALAADGMNEEDHTAELMVGGESGSGSLTMTDARFDINSTTSSTFNLGLDNARGILDMSSSQLSITSQGISRVQFGSDTQESWYGSINMKEGSSLRIEGSTAEFELLRSSQTQDLVIEDSTIELISTDAGSQSRFSVAASSGFPSTTMVLRGQNTNISGDIFEFAMPGPGSFFANNLSISGGATIEFDLMRFGSGSNIEFRDGTLKASTAAGTDGIVFGTLNENAVGLSLAGGGGALIEANVKFEANLALNFLVRNSTDLGRLEMKGHSFSAAQISENLQAFGGWLQAGQSYTYATFDFVEYDKDFTTPDSFQVTGSGTRSVLHHYSAADGDVPAREKIELVWTSKVVNFDGDIHRMATGATATLGTVITLNMDDREALYVVGVEGEEGYTTHQLFGDTTITASLTDDTITVVSNNGDATNYWLGGGFWTQLFGLAGNDTLTGGNANDRLDGGDGVDTMAGRRGNDVYVVDNGNDLVVEDEEEGNDTIFTTTNFALPTNVEVLIALGSNDVALTGNSQRNIIQGNDGANTINGSDGNNVLTGGGGGDDITTGNGTDYLNGGAGVDVMKGGIGNDTYIVDNVQDVVVELADEGDDTVYTSTSLSIPLNIEVLIASGTGDLDLAGGSERDILQGNSGNNIINGARGIDVMAGGAGNDVYAVDNSFDAVIEAAGEGYDNVYSSIDFIICETSEIESVLLTGNAVVLRGSSTNNQIFGNDVVNVLDGRGGIDYLLGFGGGDIFQITAGDDGEDVIGDFSRTDADRIAFAGFDSSNTTVTHEGDGLFTIADATADTSQTFQMRDGYGIDAYTSGDLVEGQDYYFA